MTKIPSAGSKDTVLVAISIGPSFNYTSHKKDTVAGYSLFQVIDNAVATAEHTFFNGQPAYLLDKTTQPTCMGDEAGIGGGVKSGTVGGEVKPTSGSSTIFIEGKALVREGDTCTMNNGNVKGMYVTVDASWVYEKLAALKKEEAVLYAGPTAGSGGGNVDRRTGKTYPITSEQELEVARIRKAYETMIARARFLGQDFAADNLQRFIDGEGGVRNLNPDYIKQYGAVQDADQRIRRYIENKQLQGKTGEFSMNSTRIVSKDYWKGDIREYNPLSELSYASGASEIKSDVVIVLYRNGDVYKGKGVVKSRWHDNYNWNKGQGFRIPGTGTVSDDDGIYLKEHGGAKDFLMESKWQSSFEGVYDPKTKKWESIKWKD